MTIEVSVDGETLEKRDFYTNYEYIEKCVNLTNGQTGINVFDYLADNRALELVNKNKYCQKICHWSLAENNNYIFNLYDGFSGVYIDNNKYRINNHHYLNFPSLTSREITNINGAAFWINIIDIKYFSDFYKYVSTDEKIEAYGLRIDGNTFIDNVKFKKFPKINDKPVYVLGLNFVNSDSSNLIENYKNNLKDLGWIEIKQNRYECVLCKDNHIIFIDMDKDNFAYYKLINTDFDIEEYSEEEKELVKPSIDFIKNYSLGKINPSIIVFNNSLSYYTSIGPAKNHNEIEYFKADNTYNYVIRYDGKLKPSFVEKGNYIYYKDYISANDMENTEYSKYAKYKFEPLYPSINYCAIKKNSYSYNVLPDFIEGIKINPNPEYSWFDVNKYFWLDDTIQFIIAIESSDKNSISECVINFIANHYQVDDSIANYIVNKYNYNFRLIGFDNDNDNDKYSYNITLTLK